jgi:hypothetical protein
MYALARNEGKYHNRDNRIDKSQILEYDYLAPDSVNEIFEGLQMMKRFTAKAYAAKNKKIVLDKDLLKTGEQLLEENKVDASLEILAEGFENNRRKVQLLKVPEAYQHFKQQVIYYGTTELMHFIEKKNISSWQKLLKALPAKPVRKQWKNMGGQLMTETDMQALLRNIRSGKISNWDEVHAFYSQKSERYNQEKFLHAFASLLEITKLTPARFTKKAFLSLMKQAASIKEQMVKNIYTSRSKDYSSPYRQMLYDTHREMEMVIGTLKDNSFIKDQQSAGKIFTDKINALIAQFS